MSLTAEPSADGRFGEFGGRFVPETLMPACMSSRRRSAPPGPTTRSGRARRAAARLRRPAVDRHRVPQPRSTARPAPPAQAGGPQPHRLAQDQQRPRPGVAGQAHGQDPAGRRDRRRPARRGRRHSGRAARYGVQGLHGRRRRRAPGAQRVPHAPARAPRSSPCRRGSRTLKDAVNEAMRDWVATVETTHYCLGLGDGPASVSVDGPRVPPRPRRRGPRAVRELLGGDARRRRGLRGRRFERDRHLLRVRRHRRASWSASSPPVARRWAAACPGVVHGMKSYLMQDEYGQVLEAESISAGLDYPGVGPEHSYLRRSGGPGTRRSPTTR